MTKPLRETMPETAAFVDAMRVAFGVDLINAQIKRGMAGDTFSFHALENGLEVGTAFVPANSVKLSETQVGPMRLPENQKGSRCG